MSVSGEGVYANAEKKYNPTRLFATDTNPKDKSNSIADTSKSGVFRIKRVGSTYTIYKPSGTTVLKKNGKSGTGDVVVTLYGKDNNAGCKVSGVFDNFIVINGTIKNADVCSPDWNCGVWSSCTDSLQTRTCTDDNNCGIETGKPVESRSCSANDPCANKDCGDNNDCTSDSCSQGNCINTPINCPTGQVCSRGSCVNARSTITVTYPNGGEIWYSGNDYTIKWNPSVNENPAIPKIDEYIIDNNGKNAIDPAINRSNSGSDGWTPRNVNGSFKVKICISGTTDCDESDNYFSIKSEQTTCTDSDGGKNYFIRGNFLDKATCLSGCNDSCYDGQSFMQSYGFAVAEWSCENNIANYTTYNCPNGCENGACKLECKPGQTIGDVDGNGIIDTLDSNLTASIIVGKISSPTDICCVDVSGNGGISAIDASKILRIIAGLEQSPGRCAEAPTTCTESDSGKDRYVAGVTCGVGGCKNDTCTVQEYGWGNQYALKEYSCDNSNNQVNEDYIDCGKGCEGNACKRIIPVASSSCQDLINRVANPDDLTIESLKYSSDGWDYNYSGTYWIDNKEYDFTSYSASWWINDNQNKNYDYARIYANIMVFNDESVNLNNWIKERTNYVICKMDDYWDSSNRENLVYVCSWDVLRDEQDLNNYDYNSRQVFWVSKNVVVEINVYSGRKLTNEEVSKIAQKRVNDFLNDLKNNEREYVGGKNFDISYLAKSFISKSLKNCSSDITRPVIEGTNETCNPSWECKTEPVICPEYGYQTKTCIDYGCNQDKKEEKIYCSPGLCSGCYVPRWIKSNENICMPYGARFEQQTGNIINKLVERSEDTTLSQNDNDYSIQISSANEAVFTIYGKGSGTNYTYTLTPGADIEIKIPDWEERIETVTLHVNKIVYSSETDANNYVDVTINIKGYDNVNEKTPMYCGYDGTVYQQKTKDGNGDWAKCQNNFECESNVCSGGECIDVAGAIKESGKFKILFFGIYCRLTNLFNGKGYENCISELK